MNEIARFFDNPPQVVVVAAIVAALVGLWMSVPRRRWTRRPVFKPNAESASPGAVERALFIADTSRKLRRPVRRVNRRAPTVEANRLRVSRGMATFSHVLSAAIDAEKRASMVEVKIPPTMVKSIVALLAAGDIIVVKAAFEEFGKTGLEALIGSASMATALVLGGKKLGVAFADHVKDTRMRLIAVTATLVGISISLFLLRLGLGAAWLGLALAPALGAALLGLMESPEHKDVLAKRRKQRRYGRALSLAVWRLDRSLSRLGVACGGAALASRECSAVTAAYHHQYGIDDVGEGEDNLQRLIDRQLIQLDVVTLQRHAAEELSELRKRIKRMTTAETEDDGALVPVQ